MLPPGLGKPPPLLPTPPGPPQPQSAGGGGPMVDHSPPSPAPLLPSPGGTADSTTCLKISEKRIKKTVKGVGTTYLKTKRKPTLSTLFSDS